MKSCYVECLPVAYQNKLATKKSVYTIFWSLERRNSQLNEYKSRSYLAWLILPRFLT